MGPSGCGKSTLLHCLGGLEPPDEGRVVIAGRDLYALDDERLAVFRRDHIGLVFQFFNLIPSLTAAENVALPLRLIARRRSPPSRWAPPCSSPSSCRASSAGTGAAGSR
ncbi:MAG: ATP-binding cassette domain-containing protein [Chloroflexi bacterium]|nr:MAG: ATP-binding cassette domain-containing protein [Chloroflexota bacterium]